MHKYHNKDVLHINEVTLLVKDLKVSKTFYEKILGMKVKYENKNKLILGTESKNLLTLIENKEAIEKTKTTGLYHVAYLLNSKKELANFLYNALIKNVNIIGASDHGASNAIYLNDPDNNGIEVYYDLDDFTLNNNKLNLITKPLDIEDLLKESNKDNFFIMNDKTVIGHVHFSVRDLIEAKHYFKDILGFNLLLSTPSAMFLSDKDYHHHIGVNIWNSYKTINRPKNMTGLISYNLNVPYKDEFIKRLKDNNIKVYNKEKKQYFYDINDVLVYF